MDRIVTRVLVCLIATLASARMVAAQETTGKPGSPSATTTLRGNQLPSPTPKFGGVIKDELCTRRPGGRRPWCRPKTHPTSC